MKFDRDNVKITVDGEEITPVDAPKIASASISGLNPTNPTYDTIDEVQDALSCTEGQAEEVLAMCREVNIEPTYPAINKMLGVLLGG